MIGSGSIRSAGICCTMAILVVLGGVCPTPTSAATVRVYCQADKDQLAVGETAVITVTADVGSPASSSDGLFTFDLDLILGDPAVLSVTPGSVDRPDVDDDSFGGSDGTLASWGLDTIAGGYWATDYGIDEDKVLFTVEVEALAVGTCAVSAGPDVELFGDDFVLGETASPEVDYSSASRSITVVPEPASLGLASLAFVVLVQRRRPAPQGG